LQIVGGGASHIHPDAEALIAHELDGANGFFNGGVLFFGAINLIFVDQQGSVPSFPRFASRWEFAIPSWLTGPTATENVERVHKDGCFRTWGNSSRQS